MKRKVSGLLLGLAFVGISELSQTAKADESFIFLSPKEIQEIQARMKSDPVNLEKVRENLARVSELIAEKNQDLIHSANVDVYQTTVPFIYKLIQMNLNATFNSSMLKALNLKTYNTDRIGLFLLNRVDTLGFDFEGEVNGYEFLKKSIIKVEQVNWQAKSEEDLIKTLEFQLTEKVDDLDHAMHEFTLHVIKSYDFSSFLEAAEPFLAKVKKWADDKLAKNLGSGTLAHSLVAFKYKICNGLDPFRGCWSNTKSMMIRLSGNTYLFGNADLDIKITEDQVTVNGNGSLGREQIAFLTQKLMNGTFAVDIISYKFLKWIETASVEEIEKIAESISQPLKDLSRDVGEILTDRPVPENGLL